MTNYEKSELQGLAARIRQEANGKCCSGCDIRWHSGADLIETIIGDVEELERELHDARERILDLEDQKWAR
jgi:hypothetical protein